ncbi:DEAD/DEAH box helicase [Candidatus Halobonum tyrrellensis]|uniref:Putative DNA 3'-5' helicase Rad25 n=1 Tax=Candidatus Halobonum tyrrellensis G22 TaxID=1324957 RepID=V4IVL9_9EURY|nr:DEAD/DEAH box helicase family protein [Candidatus Halobonum tyrrellensis]ESP87247.1 DNA/RNA helicase, superfamily ii [Candidatus Halobonum tyrrellensis G22]
MTDSGDAGTGEGSADAGDASAGTGVGADDAESTPREGAGESDGETDGGGESERPSGGAPALTVDEFYDAVEAEERPVLTASQVARRTGRSQAEAVDALDALTAAGDVERVDVETDPVVFYPSSWGDLAARERVVFFPERRQVVVDQPTQFTRARLSEFAHLVDSTGTDPGTRGYLYEVRQEDIWGAPFDDLSDLLARTHSVLPRRSPHFEGWVEDQWKRANQFTLRTHEDGYVVLEADREELMGNVARQKLEPGQLRADLSDTTSWVNEEELGAIKRTLYEAGYPVRDERDLDSGDPLDVTMNVELRAYQRDWRDRFMERQAGVFVGPPGSGKTIAAISVLEAVGGETLVLVPSRELAAQWRSELLDRTDLSEAQVGEYHGGEKNVRPVTVATYQTAGMDRHRSLFDSREWGLIVYDEVQHIPSDVFRRSADLQTRHRLGLSATPVREDDREEEIFTLVGPPIGTDWGALFDAGFVQEPEVEIRYVPWRDDEAQNEWASADRREKHRVAARNPAKVGEVRRLRERHADEKALIFVDYLDQGREIEAALGVPFVSGETRHHVRQRLFEEFRQGERRTLVVSRIADEGIDLPNAELAIVASGLGGSRRQGAQRAGRTMRPAGSALVYVLATRGTSEEDFAQRQMNHLAEKGVRVRERTME